MMQCTKPTLRLSLHTHLQKSKHHKPVSRTWRSKQSWCGRSSLWPEWRNVLVSANRRFCLFWGHQNRARVFKPRDSKDYVAELSLSINSINPSPWIASAESLLSSNREWDSILLSERRSSITDRARELAANSTYKNRVFMNKISLHLTLRLLMSYIYGASSKARNANVVYMWTYVWQRWNSLFLFAAQWLNTESMQRGFLCHICV